MKLMRIVWAGEGILRRVWLLKQGQNWDQAQELKINGQGSASALIEQGVEYTLSWTLIGTPGTSWKLEVPDPAEYQWKYYSSERWHSTKISIDKTLSKTCYSELRIVKA